VRLLHPIQAPGGDERNPLEGHDGRAEEEAVIFSHEDNQGPHCFHPKHLSSWVARQQAHHIEDCPWRTLAHCYWGKPWAQPGTLKFSDDLARFNPGKRGDASLWKSFISPAKRSSTEENRKAHKIHVAFSATAREEVPENVASKFLTPNQDHRVWRLQQWQPRYQWWAFLTLFL